jgi:branched-subunit amino acid transport protein
VTIAHQSATTPTAVRRAPAAVATVISPHELVRTEETRPAWTLAKIAGLLAVAALGTALILAIVVGGALFALLNLG